MSKMKNKNLTIKILALFISILLWSYVRNEVNPRIVREFRSISVEMMNERLLNESELLVLEPEEIKISVKVSGRRSDVNSISAEDITAEVDLAEASEGTQKIPIDVKVPFKVDLEDISKRYVSFEIDKLISVEREVEINTTGDNKGNLIRESSVLPSFIKVSGPSVLVEKIDNVIVDINIDKIDSNDIMKLPVKAVDRKGKKIEGLKISPDIVEVSLSLLKTKQVPIKPKLIGTLKNDFKISSVSTSPSTVTIRGLEEDIKDIGQIETEEINLSDIQSDQNINTKLALPTGISVDNGKDVVAVALKLNTSLDMELEREMIVPINQIRLENIKEGLKPSFTNDIENNISLKVKGEKNIVEGLIPEDIILTLDLNELDQGTHNVKLAISTLKEITIQQIVPEIIEINLDSLQ